MYKKLSEHYQYFKFTYMMSGRFKVSYTARVLSWQQGIVRIRDIDQKEHTLKEKFIKTMKPKYLTSSLECSKKKVEEYQQQELFSTTFLAQ